jgi:release factor glutamine methyltransferase
LGDTEDGPPFKRVLELGTGSGAIVVSLARALPHHFYFAGDISQKAVKIAKKNADRLVNSNGRVIEGKMVKQGIGFFCGSWFDALKPGPKFDLIVSNPPYIPTLDIERLAPEIREFEPRQALDGGANGLDCFGSILGGAHQYLVPGGTLLLEMGHDQEKGISSLAGKFSRYEAPRFVKDLAGHTRVAIIQKSID